MKINMDNESITLNGNKQKLNKKTYTLLFSYRNSEGGRYYELDINYSLN